MELTYLYYFKVIAERENMSRAAELLHVSQPALSKTIAKLERSLGVTLFERKKGRISLSPIGADFYRQVAKAFDCIAEGQRLINDYKNSMSTSVTIGCPVAELMNSLLLSYLKANQQSSLQISQFLYSPEVLQEKLLGGKLDFPSTIRKSTRSSSWTRRFCWRWDGIILWPGSILFGSRTAGRRNSW